VTVPPQDPGAYISSAQMYSEMRSLHDGVTRLEAKLDAIRQDAQAARADLTDHETRIRRLEAARWPLPTIGALAGVGGAIAACVALFHGG
jgi:hypothetical protein